MKPYKLQLLQQLKPNEEHKLYEFRNWAQQRMEDNYFVDRVIFSDEATFNKNGKVNRQEQDGVPSHHHNSIHNFLNNDQFLQGTRFLQMTSQIPLSETLWLLPKGTYQLSFVCTTYTQNLDQVKR